MPIVFEEENTSYNNQLQKRNQSAVRNTISPFNQIILLSFAVFCLIAAYCIPHYMNPSEKEKIVYFEDITESRMRLIPVKDREAYMSKLPRRDNSDQ